MCLETIEYRQKKKKRIKALIVIVKKDHDKRKT